MNSFNNRSSRANSKAVSIDSQSFNCDWRENISKRIYGSNSISGASSSLAPTLLQANLKNSAIYSSKESLTGAQQQSRLKTSVSNGNIDEEFAFAGVYHIFDNHKAAGLIMDPFVNKLFEVKNV